MSARILAYRIGLFTLLRELQYTLSRAKQEPLAAGYVPVFQALRDEWKLILLEEIDILDSLAQAQASVNKADEGLDAFAGRVSRITDESTSGHSRKQLRSALFKNKPLAKFRRPVLGGQLELMSDWAETLAKCGVPALVALAPEAETLIAAGQDAENQRKHAQSTNRDFRDVGTRKQFLDKVNAARKEAHGGLGKLPFENLALPRDFADGFFYSESPRDEEETIDEVKTSIEELQAQLEERQALLAKLEAEAEAEARAAEERLAQVQAVEELEAQAKALLEKAAALKAKART
ncbi:hypothetical protein [Polyangium jinanense]|uniref:Uncharacterized protein n=1 Tax=Polyangium jinanense TaxID=2829994 RepID=A0A9X3WYF9_9BACT|nr:hypothetical protein [Polyangium jinanense]MDC3953619.1 hypothetical protein [Polyangium jinanense]MDC3979260.1 hypothetical protein [Polyangium jinanense]